MSLEKTMDPQVKTSWRETPPVLAREDCTICNGTGWELMNSGGTSQARRCSCGNLDRLLRLRERVRIPKRYEDCSLDDYHPLTLSQTRALAEARKFAERYPRVSKGLFFIGPPGVGKTHLAVGILRELMQRFHDRDILFADFQTLLQAFVPRTERSGADGSEWERLRNTPLLVLDGFGSDHPSAEAVLMTEELLLFRKPSRKPTILTGDRVSSRELAARDRASRSSDSATQTLLRLLSPRTTLRLFSDFRHVRLGGQDFRMRNHKDTMLF